MLIKPGQLIYDEDKNEYEILEYIDSGAMGTVWKIERKGSGDIFALKTLPQNFENDKIINALKNESDLALEISHPNVLKYYFIHDGIKYAVLPPYIIMEFANDGNLADLVNKKKITGEFFSNEELLKIFNQLIKGMKAINKYIVHRDIKPDNILIKEGVLKISDFGLSKIIESSTRTTTFKGFGHIMYMAPEGWKFEKNDIKMDIYSMGIVFYEIAALRHPYTVSKSTVNDWQDAHLFQNPDDPRQINKSLSIILKQAILKMMAKRKNDRFENWDDIEKYISKNEKTSNSSHKFVDEILILKVAKDQKIEEQHLKELKLIEEKESYQRIIKYQFETEIINPLKIHLDNFNAQYTGPRIVIKKEYDTDKDIGYSIIVPSGSTIVIMLRILFDEDFMRTRIINDFGRRIERRELMRPLFLERRILAWGRALLDLGKGFNILLVECQGEIYGEFYILYNTNDPGTIRKRLPEPFPFEYEELEKEVALIGAGHIYVHKFDKMSINNFLGLLKEAI